MPLLPELDTTSVLHTVEENFQRIGQKAYAERIIYVGGHSLSKDELKGHFYKTMRDVNSTYCEINVRGLLLVYDSYFVHIVEGSEDTIHRHLRFLFAREVEWIEKTKEEKRIAELENTEGAQPDEKQLPDVELTMFRRLKLLMAYHSIKTLYFNDWRAVTASPPSFITKLDPTGPLAEHMEQLRICLDKLRELCELAKSAEKITLEWLNNVDPKMKTLPEINLIDYLMHSPYLLDLRTVVQAHRRVDDYFFYFEKVWPLPTQFTPKLLYKLKVDDSFVPPLPVMPWEIVKEVGEEDDKEEQLSASSSD